jgi:hypothetical protein
MFHPADEATAQYLGDRFSTGEFRSVAYRWPDGTDDGLGRVRVFIAPPGALRARP